VSFAALDVYRDIASGWKCLVEKFSLSDGTWGHAGGEHDDTTSSTPFERPTSVKNEERDRVVWLSSGGAPEWDDEPRRWQSRWSSVTEIAPRFRLNAAAPLVAAVRRAQGAAA
jgi:hypothetical protein